MTSSAAATERPWHLRAANFLRTPEGHSALLGFFGAVMITFGGFGAGSVRRQDPLLESMHLSWLRFGHGSILSAAIVWIGVLCMIAAWVRLGRSTLRGDVSLRGLRYVVPVWTFPLLFAVPMFSRDAYSYLAQGALLRNGFDPYAVGPVVNPGILLDNVSNVWTTTTTPYGPVHLLLADAIVRLTGENVIAGTMLLRITMLPGLALMMWAVPHLATKLGGNTSIALWLAVLNPLVLIHLIGGVHNEMLMVGLMAAGIALALERKHLFGIGLIALAVAIKATAGVALPFIVWIWMIHEREDAAAAGREPASPIRSFVKTAGAGFAVFVAVLGSTSLIAGVGLGWTTALSGSAKIINWLSLPTLVAEISTLATSWFAGNHFNEILEVSRDHFGSCVDRDHRRRVVALPQDRARRRHGHRDRDGRHRRSVPRSTPLVLLLAVGSSGRFRNVADDSRRTDRAVHLADVGVPAGRIARPLHLPARGSGRLRRRRRGDVLADGRPPATSWTQTRKTDRHDVSRLGALDVRICVIRVS